jgi:hypothetical protein
VFYLGSTCLSFKIAISPFVFFEAHHNSLR